MKEFLCDYGVTIGVFLTFFGTLINAYYTWKNLTTTKYIETITSERKRWLEIVRTETAQIITNIHFTLKTYLRESKEIAEGIRYQQGYDEQSISDRHSMYDVKTNSAFGGQKEVWSQSDFIHYLSLLKLRLNPNEDSQIIRILDYFTTFYTEPKKDEKSIKKANEKLSDLILNVQTMLKNEWEKVKKEAVGKRKS